MNKEEKLLREYISLLAEEAGEPTSALRWWEKGKSHMGKGGSDVGGAVKNVGKVGVGLIKKLFSRGKTILKLSKELVVTTVLKPWAKAEYDRIMDEGKAEINALKEKYKTPGLWQMIPPDLQVFAMFLNPAAAVTFGAGALAVKGAKKAFGGGKDDKESSKGKGGSSGGGGGGGAGYGGDVGSGGGHGDTGQGGDVKESSRFDRKNSYLLEYNRDKSKNKKIEKLNPEQQKELQGLVSDLRNMAKSRKGEILKLLKTVEQKEGKDSEGAESLRNLIKKLNIK